MLRARDRRAASARGASGRRRAITLLLAGTIAAAVVLTTLARHAEAAVFVSPTSAVMSLDRSTAATNPIVGSPWFSLGTIAVLEFPSVSGCLTNCIAPPPGESSGTVVLRAPDDFIFNTLQPSGTFSLTTGGDLTGATIAITSVSTLELTLSFDAILDAGDLLVIAGIQVRPTGTIPAAGAIYRPAGVDGGTVTIVGVSPTISFAGLSSVAGAPASLTVEPVGGSPTAGIPFSVRVSAFDQFGTLRIERRGGGDAATPAGRVATGGGARALVLMLWLTALAGGGLIGWSGRHTFVRTSVPALRDRLSSRRDEAARR